jgi:prevent-host-death family protein
MVYIRSMGTAVRLAEDIIPVSDFKTHAADMLRRVAETGHPLVITQNGKAAGVLLSPAEFDRLSERTRFVAAVEEGLADADAGRLRPHEEVVARMSERFRAKRGR